MWGASRAHCRRLLSAGRFAKQFSNERKVAETFFAVRQAGGNSRLCELCCRGLLPAGLRLPKSRRPHPCMENSYNFAHSPNPYIRYYISEGLQKTRGGDDLEQEKAAQLLAGSLKSLFAFSISRLADKAEAEDLTNDIVCEVLKSARRLRREEAFYGFMWRIAENTLQKHIRRRGPRTVEFDEGFAGAYWVTPEDAYIQKEQLHRLRRELALLSGQFREVTVAYYIEGKSCPEIAASLGISVDMVKYYLFKTRKQLKEGLDMTREFGEKSYHPGVFRMDYWGGGDNSCYWELFKRTLPGNILLAAQDRPATLQELSVELGVAAVYLEEEIEPLLRHGLLKKTGGTYQTNILIFTDAYDKELAGKTAPVVEAAAQRFQEELSGLLPRLAALEFQGNAYGRERLAWTFANLAMVLALQLSDRRGRERFGEYPPLSNGSFGFVFGYDNDYAHHHYHGLYGQCENRDHTAWFSVENYRVIEKCQLWTPVNFQKSVEAMCDGILRKPADPDNEMEARLIREGFLSCRGGRLAAEFPVFSAELLEHTIRPLLKPLAEEIGGCITQVCGLAAQTLRPYTPRPLLDRYEQLAYIRHQMDVPALILEKLAEQKVLVLPEGRQALCVFGVRL